MLTRLKGMYREYCFFYGPTLRFLAVKFGIPSTKKIINSFRQVNVNGYSELRNKIHEKAKHLEYISKIRECIELNKFFVFASFGERYYVFIESFDELEFFDISPREIIKIYKICVYEKRYSTCFPTIDLDRLYRTNI